MKISSGRGVIMDATVSVGPSLYSDWSASVAGTKC